MANVTIKLKCPSEDMTITRAEDAATSDVEVEVVCESMAGSPQPGNMQSAVLGTNSNMVTVVENGVWYYAMVDHHEPVWRKDGSAATYVVADCIPMTYFEAVATQFAAFYPQDIDLSEETSYQYVYRKDMKTKNEAAELRALRTNGMHGAHRKAIALLLQPAERLSLLQWLHEAKAPAKLPEVQHWYVMHVAEGDHGPGFNAARLWHSQIVRGSTLDPAPAPAKVRDILAIPRNSPTARRLARVISLDFVPEIDYGGPGTNGTEPPLNPIILPSGSGVVDDPSIPLLTIQAARIDGAKGPVTRGVTNTEGGKAMKLQIVAIPPQAINSNNNNQTTISNVSPQPETTKGEGVVVPKQVKGSKSTSVVHKGPASGKENEGSRTTGVSQPLKNRKPLSEIRKK